MGIATDNQGYVYTTGYFSDDITFDNTALSSVGSSDVYLAKLHSGQVGNDDDTTPIDPNASILYKAYPNPLHIGQSLSIKSYIAPGDQGELTLYNLRGQLVSHYTLSEGEHKIMPDVSNLSSGIYFYRLRTGAVKSVHKLVLIK